MRLPRRLCLFVTLAVAGIAASRAAAVTGGAELIMVAKVTGKATVTHGGQTEPVTVDLRIDNGAVVTTAADATVVLVFSNGASVQLEGDTVLGVDEFRQDPFTSTFKVSTITAEPSASRTRLRLERGALTADIKRLRVDLGSTFEVATPVGVVKSKESPHLFRAKLLPTPKNEVSFQISSAHGVLALAQGQNEIAVSTGQEIGLEIEVVPSANGKAEVRLKPAAAANAQR